jgi:hypothetical protein
MHTKVRSALFTKTYKRPRVADRGTLAYFCCGRSRDISKSHLHRSEYRYSSHSESIKMSKSFRMSKSFLLSVCPINIQNGGNQFLMNQGVRKRQFRKSVSLTFELPENNGHKLF